MPEECCKGIRRKNWKTTSRNEDKAKESFWKLRKRLPEKDESIFEVSFSEGRTTDVKGIREDSISLRKFGKKVDIIEMKVKEILKKRLMNLKRE